MRRLLKGLIDLIYPPRCHICGTLGDQVICRGCLSSLPFIEPPICEKCGKPCHLPVNRCRECRGKGFRFARARSLGFYENGFKEAIHKFKYGNGRGLAPLFAQLMASRVEPMFLDVDLITYVPLSEKKERERGFNQARLLAIELSKLVDKPCASTLKLVKETLDQSKLSLTERRKNVRGAFSLAGEVDVRHQMVLLIDDVFTTGATVSECSRALLSEGSESVNVLTIARSTMHR